MDQATLRAYAAHAAEIARRHRDGPSAGGGIAQHLARAFEPTDRILDVGAGSGRDLAQLVAEGHAAYGLEPVREMRDEAISAYPALEGKLFDGSLPDALPDLANLGGPFDGVLCSAVLQHLPRGQLLDCVFRASRSPIPVEADQRFRHVDHVVAKRRWVWSTWLTSGDRSRTTWSS